jgi:hypothetical protein
MNYRPARARHPYAIVLEPGVQIAAVFVLADEGFEGGTECGHSIRSPRWPPDHEDQHPEGTHASASDDAGPGAHDDPGWADLLVDAANQSRNVRRFITG